MGRVTREKEILIYEHGNGTEPYSDWLENLKDVVGRAHIQARITRLKYGNCHVPPAKALSFIHILQDAKIGR